MPYADCGPVRLYYELEGPEGAPVLVLSNSLGTDLGMWEASAAVLSRRLRVLRYDTRGHGRSGAPDGTWTVAELGGDVLALLDALGLQQVAFCGLSLGGMTGMWLAAHAPHRISSLVLCCTSAYLPPAENWRARAGKVRAGGMAAVVDAVLPGWFTPSFPRDHPEEFRRTREAFLAHDPGGYAGCCDALAQLDLRPELSAITAPTVVLAGALDPATPVAHAQLLVERITGARLVVVPDAQHLAAIERPEEVTQVIAEHLGLRSVADPYLAGLTVRREVLGSEHVDRSLAQASALTADFQEFITRGAWGSVWTRPGLDRRTRSCITLAMLVAVGAWEELALHLRAALRNGVSREEISEVLLQTAVYAGVPAANTAFAVARRVLEEPVEATGG